MKQTTGRFPLEILYDRKLDANDRLIALCCYSFANWKTGEANFSLKGLSLRAGIKDQRTVRARLKNLEKQGWLTVEARPGKRSRYTLRPLTTDESTIEEHGKRRNHSSLHSTHSQYIATEAVAANTSRARDDNERNHGRSRTGEIHAEDSGEVQSLQDEETTDHGRSVPRMEGDAWQIIGELWRTGNLEVG